MKNNIIIKNVDFNGANLLACKSNDNDKIYVGVSYICNGLGLSKNQKDRQVKNIQNDIVIKQGCVKFDAGVFDENNETIAIELNFLPLWLAKISITPKMERENPELVDKLVEYQLKAKDVLAKAFINNDLITTNNNQNTELTQYVVQMGQFLATTGQTVAKLMSQVGEVKELVKDSIQVKDSQIDKAMDLIGFRDVNTKRLSSYLKEKLSSYYGYDITATMDVYRKAKRNIFKEFKVIKWEDIPVLEFNKVYSYIDGLEMIEVA